MAIIAELNEFRKIYGQGFIKGVFTGIDNIMLYLGLIKKSRGPLAIGWDVTFNCNARCSFCDVWKMKGKGKELTTKECIGIIRQAGRAKTWAISFTGGEPLLRPDICILINEAKKQGINVNINTNGSLLKNRAKELVASGVDTITVSLDSHDPDVHNSVRGFKGLFEKAEQGISEIRKLRKDRRPHLMARFTVNKRNYKGIQPYIEYWKDKVDKVTLQPVYEGESTSFFHIKDKGIMFEEKDRKELDRLAKVMLAPDKNFDNLVKIWNTKKEYRILKGGLL